ncbi:MAG: DUF484 family protein [Steroidobacteraceae bacterium]|jgi:uncharacterized protein
MSSRLPQEAVASDSEEQAIAAYLQQHHDFFERHAQLLTRMRLHHPRNSATISLIERQVEVLREKHVTQEQQLSEFIRVARANDELAGRIHQFTRRLLRTQTAAAALKEVDASLRDEFGSQYAVLLVAGGVSAEPAPQLLRTVAIEDPIWRSFDTLFASGKPRCGQIRDIQRDFLFGAEAGSIASVALVPLTTMTPTGLLALGSTDRERFHPGMSTEFLSRMGELIADAVSRV